MSIAVQIIIPIGFGLAFFFLGAVVPDAIQGQVALGAIGVLVAVVIEMILRLAKKEVSRDMTSNLLRQLDELPKESYPFAYEMLAEYARATNSTEHPVYKDALRKHARAANLKLGRRTSNYWRKVSRHASIRAAA